MRRERGFTRSFSPAFTIVELLICILLALILLSGLFVVFKNESLRYVAARDMDRLERWLNHAMADADLWKSGFELEFYRPQGESRHFIILRWLKEDGIPQERFYADERIRWNLSNNLTVATYRWNTHAVSPAFVITALYADGTSSGETLTVSLRALITRGSDN